ISVPHYLAEPSSSHQTPHPYILMLPPPPRSTLFPYTTLFRSSRSAAHTSSAASSVQPPSKTARQANSSCSSSVSRSYDHWIVARSEEHTSELQSPYDLVCRLLLEKKKRIHRLDPSTALVNSSY